MVITNFDRPTLEGRIYVTCVGGSAAAGNCGRPVAGAWIRFRSTTRGIVEAMSDSSGRYSVILAPGRYLVDQELRASVDGAKQVAAIGFQNWAVGPQALTVGPGEHREIDFAEESLAQ